MKLNKELIREILLEVESTEDPLSLKTLNLPGHTDEEISYHICLLAEAGFLKAHDLTTLNGFNWSATRLTYEGHEFLDTIRDNEIWRKTKEIAKIAGISSINALFEIGKGFVKQKLIEMGVHS